VKITVGEWEMNLKIIVLAGDNSNSQLVDGDSQLNKVGGDNQLNKVEDGDNLLRKVVDGVNNNKHLSKVNGDNHSNNKEVGAISKVEIGVQILLGVIIFLAIHGFKISSSNKNSQLILLSKWILLNILSSKLCKLNQVQQKQNFKIYVKKDKSSLMIDSLQIMVL